METKCPSKTSLYINNHTLLKPITLSTHHEKPAKWESQVYFIFVSNVMLAAIITLVLASAFIMQLTLFAIIFNLYQPQIWILTLHVLQAWCPYFHLGTLAMNRELIQGLQPHFNAGIDTVHAIKAYGRVEV
jgi:hypothetical protein